MSRTTSHEPAAGSSSASDAAPKSQLGERIDWSQLWYPGPKRSFSEEELARAGNDAPSGTLRAVAMANYALVAFMVLLLAPARGTAVLTGLLAGIGLLLGLGGWRLWRRPTRIALTCYSSGGVLLTMGLATLISRWIFSWDDLEMRRWVLAIGGSGALLMNILWWMVAVYRAHQIEARLREQAEHQQALDMARQLATAQIQPHFLFNSLASLQHWVQAKDDRAAPMLQALTGFLRATLPLFNRERLALGDEAEAVRQYLAVMQLRLGERLRFSMDLSSQAAAAQVPPGLLLTLVENAVEHGVMPSLGGAEVQVRAAVTSGQVQLQVQDNGPGLPAQAPEGVGLSNTRSRLAQAFGDRASLHLASAEGGGCLASLLFPWTPSTPVPTEPPQPSTASSLP